MKKIILTIAALGMLSAPVTAEIPGLSTDVSLHEAIFQLAIKKSNSAVVEVRSTEEAASSFGTFNPRKGLPSTLEPIVQSR